MLRAYFDDSGTHADSRVVVIGGLIGTDEQWKQFNEEWAALLKKPLKEKPPLKTFHLSVCNAREGEFSGYNHAEQDAVIHDFRRIIIQSKLISIASAIDRRAWDELVFGSHRDELGDPLYHCIAYCIEETIRIADPHSAGDQIAIMFDQGIYSQSIKDKTDPYTYPLGRPRVRSITSGQVADVLPLQGADIVATENYWHAAEWLNLGDAAKPRAHLQHYLAHMLHEAVILDRERIMKMLSERRAE